METNFKPSKAVLKFDKFTNNYYSTNVPNFDQVSVSRDDFTVVIWCPLVNPNVMLGVDVKITFADGSAWQAVVPLSVQ